MLPLETSARMRQKRRDGPPRMSLDDRQLHPFTEIGIQAKSLNRPGRSLQISLFSAQGFVVILALERCELGREGEFARKVHPSGCCVELDYPQLELA